MIKKKRRMDGKGVKCFCRFLCRIAKVPSGRKKQKKGGRIQLIGPEQKNQREGKGQVGRKSEGRKKKTTAEEIMLKRRDAKKRSARLLAWPEYAAGKTEELGAEREMKRRGQTLFRGGEYTNVLRPLGAAKCLTSRKSEGKNTT